jgi:protein-tyrosine phosphatase
MSETYGTMNDSIYSSYSFIWSQFYVYKDKIVDKLMNYGADKSVKRFNGDNTYFDELYNLYSEPTKIDDCIYLGSAYNAANYKTLLDNDIKTIVNITSEISNYYEDIDDFTYINFKIYDTQNDSFDIDFFDNIYETIIKHQKKGNNMLIHCYAGRSRSASIVLYYLMKKKNISILEAYEYLKKKRELININNRFIQNILNADKSNNRIKKIRSYSI